jgi:hypothetical protein
MAGNMGITLVSGITALSLAGVAMQMGYANFKIKAEKQLHILNSIRFVTLIEIGLEDGWVVAPPINESETITIADVDNAYSMGAHLKNPSQQNQLYHDDSAVIIQNDNGRLVFYSRLMDTEGHLYTTDTIAAYNLTINDIHID